MKTDQKSFDLWHNGAFISQDSPVFDLKHQIHLGAGVFDSMLVKGGDFVFPEEHFSRLTHHAKIFGLEFKYSIAELMDLAQAFLEHNKLNQEERFVLNTFIVQGDNQADLLFNLKPAPEAPKDLHAILCKTTRRNEHSPLSRIKSFNYGDNILALREAQEGGAGDAILLNTSGNAACSAFGNIYADLDGTLFTPPLDDGAMDGVFRAKAVESHGVLERSLTQEDLLENAQGLYISNSVRGFYPVSTINKRSLPKQDKSIKLF